MSRLIGFMLVIGAVLLLVGAAAWGVTQMNVEGAVFDSSTFILLLVLAGVVALPLFGGGVFMLRQGAKEEVDAEEAARQRKILDMVEARGEVKISDAAIELQVDKDEVRNILERLVGLGIFSGYINWDKDMLYSSDAGELRGLEQCKNCGGDVKLTGKGVVQCPWCGAEYFLS